MPRRSVAVNLHLEKCRAAALDAVAHYNRPGAGFRTRMFIVLMNVAWVALFHAIFYQRKIKPWYQKDPNSSGIRYRRIDGEPKHWDLAHCLNQYWGGETDPAKANLEFFIAMRNKIEHRYHPELDPALFGECQANLTNFEEILVREFGPSGALSSDLRVSLQFAFLRPDEQRAAIRKLQRNSLKDIREFIETFRAGLSPEVLESSKFALRVFLIPKLVNSRSAADLPVEFVHYDATDANDVEAYEKTVALIKERHVSVVGLGLLRPRAVVDAVESRIPFEFNMSTHTAAWKYFKVRPPGKSEDLARTNPEYCVYDELANAHGYTDAWVELLCERLKQRENWIKVVGREPRERRAAKTI